MSAFVLGFSDEAAQIAGLAWSLGGRDGVLLARAGERSEPGGDAAFEDGTVRAATSIDGEQATVTFEPGAEHALTDGALASGGRAAVEAAGGRTNCRASLTRWDGDPVGAGSILRHVALPASGDGHIVVIATRPRGATDHAAEKVAGWAIDKRGATAFGETLLSTQYDESGAPVRATIELWPADPDGHAQRAAGDRPVLGGDGNGTSVALLHSSAEGTTGIGGYVLVRT